MTISTSTSQSGPYAGAGTTGPFTVTFRFLEDSHLKVVRTLASDGSETRLTLGLDYTVIGAGGDGGFVNLTSPLSALYTLTIVRDVPYTQTTDYTQSDPFPAESHENALDKLTMLGQQLKALSDRSIRVPEVGALPDLPPAAARKGYFLGFDSITGAVTLVTGAVGSLLNFGLQLASSIGASLVGFIQSGVGAVARTLQATVREISVNPMQFGAVGDGVADDTFAFQSAITAVVNAGGWGVVDIPNGKTFRLAALSLDGVIGLTLRGKNGGNVGNLTPGSTGGASFLRFTNATGDCLSFTGVAYHAAKICLQDITVYGNTSGNVLKFDNVSEIHFDRCSITNAGGTTATTGNGILISNCYYVYFNGTSVWKSGTLYTVGRGVTINRGAQTTFLGGLYNFKNSSAYGWQTGCIAGSESDTPTANENYANINFIDSELNSNSIGLALLYGVKVATIKGSYVEGNLQWGVWVANQAQNVSIVGNFFNNSTATGADLQLGLSGAGASYPKFFNVAVRDNLFLGTNVAGININGAAGNSLTIENNRFTLGIPGSVGIKTNQSVSPNFVLDIERCAGYGYAAGNFISGGYTSRANCSEYDSAGAPIASTSQAVLRFASYPTDYQVTAMDPKIVSVVNTRAGAKMLGPNLTFASGAEYLIANAATSTQNLVIRDSSDAITLATLTPGQKAKIWNDGVNSYGGQLT